MGDRYGFIDTTGAVVFTLEPEYYPMHFSDGLALVVQTIDSTDRWGYINKKGEWVIPRTSLTRAISTEDSHT